MKALSDPTRFSILQMLLLRDFCVGGLARTLDISEAAVSQHLRILKGVGIVTGTKHGYFMHYQVERDVLESLAQSLMNLIAIDRIESGKCQPRAQDLCKLCNAEHRLS